MSEIILIAAYSGEKRVIGNKGELPWPRLKEDFSRFKSLTLEHPVIMGRTTYDSIVKKLGKPLPNRFNIVLSQDPKFKVPENVRRCYSLYDALGFAEGFEKDIYIIGGEQVYRQTINLATKLELTEIENEFEGDAFFPEIDDDIWHERDRLSVRENVGDNIINYSFVTYNRKYSFVTYNRKQEVKGS